MIGTSLEKQLPHQSVALNLQELLVREAPRLSEMLTDQKPNDESGCETFRDEDKPPTSRKK